MVRDRVAHFRVTSGRPRVGACARRCFPILSVLNRMGLRLAAFALLAMVVRALVPSGFMLAHADGADGGRYLTIELCEEHAGPLQVVDLDTGEVLDADDLPKGEGDASNPPPCVFGGAAAVHAPDLAVAAVILQASINAAPVAIEHVRPGRGIAAPPPPSTGPPVLI